MMSKNSFIPGFDFRLAILGFLVALFSAGIGIGGGTLLVSILTSFFGFDFKKAAGISLATIIPISFVGAVNHLILLPGPPTLRFYLLFIPACVCGTVLGGRMVQKHHTGWLKLAFALFLLVVSLRMLKICDFPFLIYTGLHALLLSHESFLVIPVGILIGMIAVLLGIGCGLLIVPFFVIVLQLDIHQAIPLSLTTMFFLSVSATLIHNKLNL
ncbi:sulfite exporter TauE/SafE family protein [Desulfoluna butyratoxydans]|nr:sulfite exporter TauE/SafE family protein [Desulfoluna butyratoxydans]